MDKMQSKRPSKRQRKENPPSWLENETLAFVASPQGGTIQTPVASKHDKDIFLGRLQKEIIPYYKRQAPQENTATKDDGRQDVVTAIRKRVIMGTNQCTRQLEKILASTTTGDTVEIPPLPSLIVLARDVYPPLILSHIPVMVEQVKLQIEEYRSKTGGTVCKSDNSSNSPPILLLPGQASQELGSLFGTKRVSVLLFMPPSSSQSGENKVSGKGSVIQDVDDRVTSFVQFVTKTLQLQSN